MNFRSKPHLVALFTDFGSRGPYVGQMQAVLAVKAPGVPVVDLMSGAPSFRPRPASYLLASLAPTMPEDALFLAVVDPGVGGERRGLVVRTDRHWLVGPDNGLLSVYARQAKSADCSVIRWQPEALSASFHGRDVFAPVAAKIARGQGFEHSPVGLEDLVGWNWPLDLAEVVFIDDYGNAIIGLRARTVGPRAVLTIAGEKLGFARTFSSVAPGAAFWHENSNGLVEIAVNGASAQQALGLEVGAPVQVASVNRT